MYRKKMKSRCSSACELEPWSLFLMEGPRDWQKAQSEREGKEQKAGGSVHLDHLKKNTRDAQVKIKILRGKYVKAANDQISF